MTASESDEHRVYLEERRIWVDVLSEQTKFIDQITISLAAGGLGLSLAFLRDLPPPVEMVLTLYFGNGALVISIIAVLLSLHVSQRAIQVHIRNLDDAAAREQFAVEAAKMRHSEHMNTASRWTKTLNISALVFLIIGIVFLLIFGYYNGSNKLSPHKMIASGETTRTVMTFASNSGAQRGAVPISPAVVPPSPSPAPSAPTPNK